MYCACFSVGKMCDEVNQAWIRPASVKAARTALIIWIDPKPYAKWLNEIHMPFLEKARVRSCQRRLVTVLSLPALKSIATVSGVASSAVRLASAKDAEIMRTNRTFLSLNPRRLWSLSDLFSFQVFYSFFIVESLIHNLIVRHGQCLRVIQQHRGWIN